MKKLILLLLVIIAAPSYAAERQFDIEMIIFKRAVNPEQSNETWPNSLSEIDITTAARYKTPLT